MKLFIIIFLVIMLGGLYAYLNFFAVPASNTEIGVTPTPGGQDSGVIQINVQPAGNFISIRRIMLKNPGFAVIYDDNGGRPGKIIGNSTVLTGGETFDIAVGLVRPSVRGEILYVMIHDDTGDGLFTPELDVPVKDDEGNLVFVRFSPI